MSSFSGYGSQTSPGPGEARHNVLPASASHMSFPISPRVSIPGYIRRSSAATGSGSPVSSTTKQGTLPSTPSSSTNFSSGTQYFPNVLSSGASTSGTVQGPDIMERPRDRTRNSEVSSSALAFLFAEVVSYTQNRVLGISDLEKK